MTKLPLLALALLGASAACSPGAAQVASTGDNTPSTSLTITLAADDKDKAPKSWTLTCDPAGGSHPDAAGACAQLAAATDPFGKVPSDAVCTEIYGGSTIGTVVGAYKGKTVDATFTRVNGCHIARWDAVGKLFPGPLPGQP